MKALIFFSTLLAAGVVNAKTICSIDAVNPQKPDVYDQVLYSGEVSSAKYLILKPGGSQAHEFSFEQMSTLQQWQASNGDKVFTFSPTAGGTYAITISHVDVSKANNLLPLDAMAVGQPNGPTGLQLILPNNGISASCVSL